MPVNVLIPSYGLSNSRLEEATAQTSHVLAGETFYARDKNLKTGTMTNIGAWNSTINPGNSVTIPAGYHNGSGTVIANAARTSQILCAYVYDTHAEKYRVLGTDNFYFSGLTCQKACNVRIRGQYKLWAWSGIEIRVNGSNIYKDSTNDPAKSSSYNITRYMNAGDTIGIYVTKLGYGIYCDIVVEAV